MTVLDDAIVSRDKIAAEADKMVALVESLSATQPPPPPPDPPIIPNVAIVALTLTILETVTVLAFEVRLSQPTTAQVSVRVQSAGITATSGQDFQAVDQVATFAPGETVYSRTTNIINDDLVEGDETFKLVLLEPVNCVIVGGEATVTIKSEDIPPTPIPPPASTTIELFKRADFVVSAPSASGNLFDIFPAMVWTHESGAKRTTEGFYIGTAKDFAFRFGAALPGKWTGVSSSPVAELDGKTFTVNVSPSTNAARLGYSGSPTPRVWGQQRGNDTALKPWVPVATMWPALPRYVADPAKWSAFLDAHGFNCVHISGIGMTFFDADAHGQSTSYSGSWLAARVNPDPVAFDRLEAMIETLAERGVTTHFWLWHDGGRAQTFNQLSGGFSGAVHQRLIRYLCARLAPVPGWMMGAGFDLDEWMNSSTLDLWLAAHISKFGGYHHCIGGRYAEGGDGGATNSGQATSGGIAWNTRDTTGHQVASWEIWQNLTSDAEIDAVRQATPNPMFAEDRFRLRSGGSAKDFSSADQAPPCILRFGLRHAGAVYGNLLGIDINTNPEQTAPWPNAAAIKAAIAQVKAAIEVGQDPEPGPEPQPIPPQPEPPPSTGFGASINEELPPIVSGNVAVYAGSEYPTISAAISAANDGTGIDIIPGRHVGAKAVAQYYNKRLTIRGIRDGQGRAPALDASGLAISKAILNPGKNSAIEHITLMNASTQGRTGSTSDPAAAGWRPEPGCLVAALRYVMILGCQAGILTPTDTDFADVVLIEDSVLKNNGVAGTSHNAYFGWAKEVRAVRSTFRDQAAGNTLKSRALRTILEHSLVIDSRAGARTLECPDGGLLLVTFSKIVKMAASNSQLDMIAFNSESQFGSQNRTDSCVIEDSILDGQLTNHVIMNNYVNSATTAILRRCTRLTSQRTLGAVRIE